MLSPGTYIIHCNFANVVIDDVKIRGTVEVHVPHKGTNQQWYVQRSERGGYAIKNVSTGLFLGTGEVWGGSRLERACKHDANVWNIEHEQDDVYSVSVFGTQSYLTLPSGKEAPSSPLLLVERKVHVGQLWRFERLSDDSGGSHRPQLLPPPRAPSNPIVSNMSSGTYVDDAHFHTDMLFNMPRSPFTRAQRAAALEWARKLGATNVPTLESFDECERRVGSG